MAGLVLTVPISGLATAALPALLPALVLAAAQAPLIMLTAAAFAGNRVQGLALLKILSGLVMFAASTPCWLPGPAIWPLLLLPPTWATHTQKAAEAGTTLELLAGLCAGAVLTALYGAVLTRRTITKITT
jgi:fluoroquinolone transport system permease protein